jgi:hypothetical protein
MQLIQALNINPNSIKMILVTKNNTNNDMPIKSLFLNNFFIVGSISYSIVRGKNFIGIV